LTCLAQVAVGRGDHADVDPRRPGLAHAPDLTLLQHAQELRLQVEGQLADLVEEERPTVGRLDQPLLRLGRAGERAAHVAEQLGRDQLARDGPAVHDHERPGGARRGAMDGLGDRLLPRPGLPFQEDRGLGRRDPRQQAEQLAHRPRRAEDLAEAVPRVGADGHGLVGRQEVELGVLPQPEARPPGHRHRPQARAAVKGAVGRIEVGDLDAVGADLQLQVVARDGRVGQAEVGVGVGAEDQRAGVEGQLLAGVGALDDDQAEAAGVEGAGRGVGVERSGGGRTI
jgi:hypothetical protein